MEVRSIICSKIDGAIAMIIVGPTKAGTAYIKYEGGISEWVHIGNFVEVNPDTPQNRLAIQLKYSGVE